jgi:hypothetical protein
MRHFSAFLILAVLSTSAFADEPAPKDAASVDPAPKHAHMTWEEQFTQANKAGDGHLTLEEAKVGYKTIARHFKAIDTDGKGYVTQNDVRAWHAQHSTAHKREDDDPLRPRPAYQQMAPREQRTMNDLPAPSVCCRSDGEH